MPTRGIEPRTLALQVLRSTTELYGRHVYPAVLNELNHKRLYTQKTAQNALINKHTALRNGLYTASLRSERCAMPHLIQVGRRARSRA